MGVRGAGQLRTGASAHMTGFRSRVRRWKSIPWGFARELDCRHPMKICKLQHANGKHCNKPFYFAVDIWSVCVGIGKSHRLLRRDDSADSASGGRGPKAARPVRSGRRCHARRECSWPLLTLNIFHSQRSERAQRLHILSTPPPKSAVRIGVVVGTAMFDAWRTRQ